MNKKVYMGTGVESWMSNKKIKYITFNVTDDCNLACTYCYFTHKTNKKVMSFEIARKAIDAILDNPDFLEYDGVVWDFIGGEPTLELKLIDSICDYILTAMYKKNHKWLYCYRFFIGSNGILYSSPEMQQLIKKHGMNLEIGITIDGSKQKHDLSRIKRDGSGSYDDIVKQIPLWQKQQGGISTKATFAHDDLPYLKDSVINLWNLGIKNVMANVVFENVWEEGDDDIFKQQLVELADYIIENDLWYDYSVRFFSTNLGMPITEESKKRNFCGTGSMLAISTDGYYFPCVRFMDSAFNNHTGLSVGNIYNGWDKNKLRAFKAVDTNTMSSDECLNCEIASGCSWCSGFNYDDSETGTLFERKTYLCKMHKANVEACKYLWNKYEETTGNISPRRIRMLQNTAEQQKWLYILVNSTTIPFCNYQNKFTSVSHCDENIDTDILEKAMAFCDKNNYNPIFIGNVPQRYKKKGYVITDNLQDDLSGFSTCFIIDHKKIDNAQYIKAENVILSEKMSTIVNIVEDVKKLIINRNIFNISLYIQDLSEISNEDLDKYEVALQSLADILAEEWGNGRRIEMNVLSHILHTDHHKECKAGTYSLALGPDGKFYPCPAFYYDNNNDWSIGNIDGEINNKYYHLCDSKKSKLCSKCDAYHCNACKFLSKKMTNEFCVPPEQVCLKGNIEREASRYFCELLKKKGLLNMVRHPVTYPLDILDPLLR